MSRQMQIAWMVTAVALIVVGALHLTARNAIGGPLVALGGFLLAAAAAIRRSSR